MYLLALDVMHATQLCNGTAQPDDGAHVGLRGATPMQSGIRQRASARSPPRVSVLLLLLVLCAVDCVEWKGGGGGQVMLDHGNVSWTRSAQIVLRDKATLRRGVKLNFRSSLWPARINVSKRVQTYGDVCVSGKDELLVPDQHLDPQWRAELQLAHTIRPLESLRLLRNLTHHNSYILVEGDVAVVNCFRQLLSRTNPFHLLSGYTTLLQAIEDGELAERIAHRQLSAVVFHQCSGGAHAQPPWELAQVVWRVIERKLLAAGLVNALTNLVTLGATVGSAGAQASKHGELTVCGRRLHALQPSYHYIGRHGATVLRSWHEGWVAEYNSRLPEHAAQRINVPTADDIAETPGGTCGSRCSRRLKVVLWQRDEKSANGRRKLFGVAAVAELVRQISHVPLRVIRPSSSMPWVEQVRLVRSADVIISAHSSGLVNVIFAHPATVVIELQAVHTDGTFCVNGRRFVRGYLMSYGHLPVTTNGTADYAAIQGVDRCAAVGECKVGPIKSADLLVDTERLRADLHAADTLLCSCSTAERRKMQKLAQCFRNRGSVIQDQGLGKRAASVMSAAAVSGDASRGKGKG